MKKYIALLGNLNVSAGSMLATSKLKQLFEENNFHDVVIHGLNGDIIFNAESEDKIFLATKIKKMIEERLNYFVPTIVVSLEELEELVANKPIIDLLDGKKARNNVIFMVENTNSNDIREVLGGTNSEFEVATDYKNIIYWSFILEDYKKSIWRDMKSSSIKNKIIIRPMKDIKKIILLAKNDSEIKKSCDEMTAEFIIAFPKKLASLNKHIKEYDGLLGHIFYIETLLKPLKKILIKNKDDKLIRKYYEFIEKMWREGDESVVNIVDVSLIEGLSYEFGWNNITKYISNEFKDYINNDLIPYNIMMSNSSMLR